MPRYRALQRVFVDNCLREAGEEFVSDSEPHPTAWEALDKPEPPAAPEAKPISSVRAAAAKAKAAARADADDGED